MGNGLGKNGLFVSKRVQEEHAKRMEQEKADRAALCRAATLEILQRLNCRQTATMVIGPGGNQPQVFVQAMDTHNPIVLSRRRELWLRFNPKARNRFTAEMAERQKGAEDEKTKRAIQCRQELEAIFKLYNCTQSAVMQIAEGGCSPQVVIIGLDGPGAVPDLSGGSGE